MKEFVEVILEADPQHIGPLLKVTGGQICREKLWNTLKNVTSASGTHRVYTNQGESLIHCLVHGHLLNGAQTSSDNFPKQWETRNISQSAQTILRSGLKRNLQQIFEMWMQNDSYGKTLSLGLASLMCSSRTMDFSLIAKCSENTAVNWGLLTGILLRLTPKGMDRLKL